MSDRAFDERVTGLLAAAARGDAGAADRLWRRVYGELRELAGQQMCGEPRTQGLQPTALVHEAYMRLVGSDDVQWANRRHFFGAAAEAMRRIRVDYARTRRSIKRGGRISVGPLEDEPEANEPEWTEFLEVNDALAKLEVADPIRAEVVKLRYFAGLSVPEVADVLGVSPRTVDNHWRVARTWLLLMLTRDDAESSAKGCHD